MSDYDPSDEFKLFEMGMEYLTRLENEMDSQKSTNLDEEVVHVSPRNELRIHYPLPSLDSLIQELAPLDANTVVIGVCEDGLPILLDLTNPASGCILLVGDRGSGKTRLLASMVQSACLVTPPRALRVAGITTSQLEWQRTSSSPHRYKWTSTRGLESAAIVHELAKISEQRRFGRENCNTLLFIIDELSELLENLDAESIELLTWLVNHGPANGVWTLASLDASRISSRHEVIEAFGTCLYGNLATNNSGIRIGQIPAEVSSSLIAGAQFCLKIEDNWLRFWIPSLE
jgi:hypothetical protein